MAKLGKAHVRKLLFRISVLIKGLDGVLEIVGGVALWVVSKGLIVHVVGWLTQDEITEDPHDLVANYLRHSVRHFSASSQHFIAVYLFGHGVVKVILVAALLKGKLWAFPVAIIVFGGYIVYQIYRFTLTGAIGLIALSVLDLIVIVLVWLEYRAMKSHPTKLRL